MVRSVNVGMSDAIRAGLLGEARLRKRFGADIPEAHWTPAIRRLREQPVLARIDHIISLLQSTDAADAVYLCDALCEHIATFRDASLDTLERRRTFVEYGRKEAWPVLQRVALARISQAQATGDAQAAQMLEQRLLLWAEQFENRLLVEELRLVRGRVVQDAAKFGDAWEQGKWGFVAPWDQWELRQWTGEEIVRWLDNRTSACLGCHAFSEQSTPAASDESTNQTECFGFEPESGLSSLEELVPPRCVWIRALFDDEQRLLWWAWVNDGGKLRRLECQSSAPGARQRLEAATRAFDEATEMAWEVFKNCGIPSAAATQAAFRRLTEFLSQASVGDPVSIEERDQFIGLTTKALANLRAMSPALAESGNQLLHWLLNSVDDWEGFPRLAWEHWNADRELRRQIELDSASRTHLAALAAEWDLSPLWDQDRLEADWATTDVLFQVPGPLLAMPYAWLGFGGQPLFEQVASTSTALSLTLRDASFRRAGERVVPTPALLSAQWLNAHDRRAHGLPLLHAALRRLAEGARWKSRALGDDPKASVSNLCRAVREGFGIVVVGAHGELSQAGVVLSEGELWCGDGADLSTVDLLILCCCAVGRLTQRGQRDVEGMYARLAVNGARCVVAARWPIADIEAALLLGEFVREYLETQRENGVIGPFDRARALNRARRRVLGAMHPPLRVSMHEAAAFEMYGFG